MTGDGETVTPSLPEPGVWTGMAQANVLAPLRWKRAKIHRGSRRRIVGPHQEAGYTSAVVTVARIQSECCNRAGSIYVHTFLGEFAIVGRCVHTALLIAVQAGALTRLSATTPGAEQRPV